MLLDPLGAKATEQMFYQPLFKLPGCEDESSKMNQRTTNKTDWDLNGSHR